MHSLANVWVAITRPTDQANKLSAAISSAGGEVIAYPLIAIAPLADYSAFDAQRHRWVNTDWLIFISSNAVQQGMPRLQAFGIPHKVRFAAIGPVTARELASYGIPQVTIPEGRFDSEALLALPEFANMQGQTVTIVRGVGGREVLADTLRARGANVQFAECYRRINPQIDTALLDKAWQAGRLHAIVVTSAEALRCLLALAKDAPWLHQVKLCVNHARIAEEAAQVSLHAYTASAPGDEAMLALLSEVCGQAKQP